MILTFILKVVSVNKMHSAIDASYKLLQLAKKKGIELSNLQVQKLVYIAHGYTLALTGKPLIEDTVQAWKYGPVLHDVYHKLKVHGRDKVPTENIEDISFEPEFSAEEISCMEGVLNLYGEDTPGSLISITHQDDTPWSYAWVKREAGEKFTAIRDEDIKAHYRKVITAPDSVNGL